MKSSAKKVLIMVGVLVFVAVGLIFLGGKLDNRRARGTKPEKNVSSGEIAEISVSTQTTEEDKESPKYENSSKTEQIFSGEAVVLVKKDGKITLSIDNDLIKGSQEFGVDKVSYDKLYVGQVIKIKYKIVNGSVVVLAVGER